MEVGGRGRLYTYRYAVTARMISALRWAAMRAILMFQLGSDGQSHRTMSTNHNLFEERGEPKRVSNRGPSAYQPNALPLGQTGSQFFCTGPTSFYSEQSVFVFYMNAC